MAFNHGTAEHFSNLGKNPVPSAAIPWEESGFQLNDLILASTSVLGAPPETDLNLGSVGGLMPVIPYAWQHMARIWKLSLWSHED